MSWTAVPERRREQLIVRCITNRHLSVQDYFTQIEQIAKARPEALIIREKDLPEPEYERLAAKVLAICTQYEVPCIFHTYVQAAIRLGVPCVHLPLQALLDLPLEQKQQLTVLGASVHSQKEALLAEQAGASYLAAGHVFATDCKPGVPARGLSFLKEVCAAVQIPVYALGGICAERADACIRAGAQGVCVMSECMQHTDVEGRLQMYGA